MKTYIEENFDYIYNEYSHHLYNIAYGYTLNKEDALDVIQNTFLKLLRVNKDFKNFDDIKYYLIRITINESLDLLKSNYKNKIVLNDALVMNSPTMIEEENIYITLAVEKLPVKYKTVIILHYYDFMPIKDIARTLNISEGAVKKRLERARKELKEYLERN